MNVFLGLLTFTFLILMVASGFWWFIADHNDKYNDPKKRSSGKSISFQSRRFRPFLLADLLSSHHKCLFSSLIVPAYPPFPELVEVSG